MHGNKLSIGLLLASSAYLAVLCQANVVSGIRLRRSPSSRGSFWTSPEYFNFKIAHLERELENMKAAALEEAENIELHSCIKSVIREAKEALAKTKEELNVQYANVPFGARLAREMSEQIDKIYEDAESGLECKG